MRRFVRKWRVELALVILALAVIGPVVAPLTPQPASRYALTAALADKHTVDVDGYPLGVDKALYNGHLRSDKAPGQPVLAVPFYAVARVFGAEPATRLRAVGNLGLWFVAFWTSVVPFALLLVLMYRAARRIVPADALAGALAIGFGGLLLPYTAHLFGHVLGAALAFGAWYVVEPDPRDARRLAAAGALLGGAVFVEYHAAVVAACVFLYVAYKAARRVGWLVSGALPFVVALGWYEDRAFGAPWRLPFAYFAGSINGTSDGGYQFPTPHDVGLMIAGRHGLLWNCPIVLVAVGAACWLAWTARGALRRDSLLALAIFAPLFVLVAGWSGTPTLETPGPRYLAPAIPFLAVPMAAVWQHARRIFTATALWGAFVGVSAILTTITVASELTPAREYLEIISRREFSPTIWSMAAGPVGAVFYVACVLAALALLVRVASTSRGTAMATSASASSGPDARGAL